MSESDESFVDEPLPVKARQFFDLLHFYAAGAIDHLEASWKRPGRHNKKIERLAMWYSVSLELGCEQIRSPDSPAHLYYRSLAVGNPETRYDIESAVQLIPPLFPYANPDEKSRLRAFSDRSFEDWGETMAQREPRLVAQWHSWLWQKGNLSIEGDHGQASVFAVAVSRLATGLEQVLSSS
jgi:hypothetical protein